MNGRQICKLTVSSPFVQSISSINKLESIVTYSNNKQQRQATVLYV